MPLEKFVRRQKWRLRPLKRVVLPWRRIKRALVAWRRRPPAIARSTAAYRGTSFVRARQLHPSWVVQPIPNPLHQSVPAMGSSEPASIYELRNIDFWGRYGGSVVTSDNFLLGDLSPEVWGVENHALFSRLRLPESRPLVRHTAIAVTPEAAGNYYHWLIDLLPRVALLQSVEEGFHTFDRFLINGSHAPYEAESLQALGVPAGKINYVEETDRFQIEQATLPSMDHGAKVIAPWKIEVLRALRDSLPPAPKKGARRLYVSRKDAAVRRVINEPELESILRENGFTAVTLESHSWAEQVSMFAEAEVVLAPHGAALANIAFCKPGAVLVEINTRAGYRDFYLQLAASAGLRYHFIQAQPRVTAGAGSQRATENEDMMVAPLVLQELVRALP